MNKYDGSKIGPEELLDQVLEEVREQPIPPFPQHELNKPTMHASDRDLMGRRAKSGLLQMSIGTAAALAIVACLFFLLQNTQTAFAQVQEAIKAAKTIQYTVLDYHGDAEPFRTDVFIAEPGLSRANTAHDGDQITDLPNNSSLTINHENQTAELRQLAPSEEFAANRNHVWSLFRNVSEHATERLGAITFEGKAAEEFVVTLGDREFLVVVDSETKLPIQMEFTKRLAGGVDFREVITNFVFDAELDPTLFAMDAPVGYEVKTIELGATPPLAEIVVVSPGNALGLAGFGSSKEEIVEVMGEPSDITDYESTERLHYNSAGMNFLVHKEEGLLSIRCLSQKRNGPSVLDFAGQTDQGIQIGDSVEDLEAAYGEAEMVGPDYVGYIRKGLSFYIQENSVTGMEITKPVSDDIEIIVDNQNGTVEMRPKQDDE